MSNDIKISIEEVLELVTFYRDSKGRLRISVPCDVYCDVGDVIGEVNGTVAEDRLMSNDIDISIEEVLELVTFTRDSKGRLRVVNVLGSVIGDVDGSVWGDVGAVWGDVGYVGGDVGEVYGDVGDVIGEVNGTVAGESE